MTITCKACDNELSESFNLGGLCPRCVLEASRDADPVPPDTPASEQLAAMFPDLEILECLGRGGMGVVYRVRQIQLARPAALKIMLAPQVDGADFTERFFREARALARLDHPGVVRVFDVGETEGQAWMLMEYVDGANLRTLLRERAITPTLALSIVRQVCEALQSAHELGIVHRDIKPENVLLDRYGHAKLVDFGLAKLRVGLDDLLTRTQLGLGTANYAAPEQTMHAANVDARADVYSLGVLCYELLTGELPLGRFDPPSQRAGFGTAFDEVILRAMERNPARRQRDAGELRSEIERACATLQAVAARLGERDVEAAVPTASAVEAGAPIQGVPVAETEATPRRWTTPAWYGMLACTVWVVAATLLTWDTSGRTLWSFDNFEDITPVAGLWVSSGLLCLCSLYLVGRARVSGRALLAGATVYGLVLAVGMWLPLGLCDFLLGTQFFIMADFGGANPAAPSLLGVALIGLHVFGRLDRKAVRDGAARGRLERVLTKRRIIVGCAVGLALAIGLEIAGINVRWLESAMRATPEVVTPTLSSFIDRDLGDALATVGKAEILGNAASARVRAETDARARLSARGFVEIQSRVLSWLKELGSFEASVASSIANTETLIRPLVDSGLAAARVVRYASRDGVQYALMVIDDPYKWTRDLGKSLTDMVVKDDTYFGTQVMKLDFEQKIQALIERDAKAAGAATDSLLSAMR